MSSKPTDSYALIGKVIKRSNIIEQLLHTHYKVKTGSLHKTIDELDKTLPAVLARAIRVIAVERNEAAHKADYTTSDVPKDFDRLCDEIEQLIPYFAQKQKEVNAAQKPPIKDNAANSNQLESIFLQLQRTKPGKHTAAINVIKSQGSAAKPITDETAVKIWAKICAEHGFPTDPNAKLTWDDHAKKAEAETPIGPLSLAV